MHRRQLASVWVLGSLFSACVGSDHLASGTNLGGTTEGQGETSTGSSDVHTLCGNAVLEPPEVCDDGTNDGRYGSCAPDCMSLGPHCGDAEVTDDEICDDGVNDGTYGRCLADCSGLGPHCGDGEVQGSETCDDGNLDDGDACGSVCLRPGSVVWGVTYDLEGADSKEVGVAIVAAGTDAVVNVANLEIPGQQRGVVHVRYGRDGTLQSAETITYAGSQLYVYAAAAEHTGQVWLLGSRATATGTFGWRHRTGMFDEDSMQITGGPFSHIYGFDEHVLSRRVAVGRSASHDSSLVAVETSDRIALWEHRDAELQYQHTAFDAGGNVYVTGSKPTTSELFLRKYSHDGVLLWTRNYKEEGAVVALGMDVDAVGGAVVVGQSITGPNAVRAIALGWSADGESRLAITDSVAPDAAWSDVASLPNGGLLLVGWTGGVEPDALVRKLTDAGEIEWTLPVAAGASVEEGDDLARLHAVTVDDAGRVFASGEVWDADDLDDPVGLWTGRIVP